MSEAAYDLAEESGLAALSARSLARKTGMSPSAINYHIGNRERLIAQIAFKAIAVSSRWRQSQAALQEEGAPRWAELDHVFTSLLQDRLSTGRMVMALLQELENEAVASGQTAIEEALREEMFAETAFWRDLAIRHGESVDAHRMQEKLPVAYRPFADSLDLLIIRLMKRFDLTSHAVAIRNLGGLLSAALALFISVTLFGYTLEMLGSDLPKGNEFGTSAGVGLLMLVAMLALLKPQRWVVVAAISLYLFLVFPLSFDVGCGTYGQCI